MANGDNLNGHGFHERTASEQREIARLGGKASGEARRKKADFRKTLNALLTAEIDNPDITPFLKSIGVDSTLEAAVNAAMIREAMQGNVKAYIAIKDVLGQTSKSDTDIEEQKLRMKAMGFGDENTEEQDDGFLDALNASASDDWSGVDEEEI